MLIFWMMEVFVLKLMIYSVIKYVVMIWMIDEGSKESSRVRYVLFFWWWWVGKCFVL